MTPMKKPQPGRVVRAWQMWRVGVGLCRRGIPWQGHRAKLLAAKMTCGVRTGKTILPRPGSVRLPVPTLCSPPRLIYPRFGDRHP